MLKKHQLYLNKEMNEQMEKLRAREVICLRWKLPSWYVRERRGIWASLLLVQHAFLQITWWDTVKETAQQGGDPGMALSGWARGATFPSPHPLLQPSRSLQVGVVRWLCPLKMGVEIMGVQALKTTCVPIPIGRWDQNAEATRPQPRQQDRRLWEDPREQTHPRT